MSKITNALLMLKLLSNGRVYQVKELSEQLGVTERMVRNYKEQLEDVGYIIESFKGPGGGYYLDKSSMISIDYFNKYDLEILDRIEKEITILNDKELINDFIELNKKIHSTYEVNKVLSEYDNDIFIKENDEKIKMIDNSIKNKMSVYISYLGISGGITNREIIPISLFKFESNIYVTAFCKLRGSIRHFNLTNILSINKNIE